MGMLWEELKLRGGRVQERGGFTERRETWGKTNSINTQGSGEWLG